MKYTLLELTQAVLSSMDSDEVNSISDTPESQQVVTIIKTVYDDLISRGGLVSNKTLFNLVPSSDLLQPIIMSKPQHIDRIEWVKYNVMLSTDIDPVWEQMIYLPPEDFINYTHSYNPSENNVDTYTYNVGDLLFTFTYRTDTAPRYFTSFNDSDVVFDAYDSTIDSTLQGSKTLCYGKTKTNFLEEDDFVPNLQPQQFSLLLNEAKSLAWAELKQIPHGKAEVTARRGWRHLQKTRQTIPEPIIRNNSHSFDTLPNFGRRR